MSGKTLLSFNDAGGHLDDGRLSTIVSLPATSVVGPLLGARRGTEVSARSDRSHACHAMPCQLSESNPARR